MLEKQNEELASALQLVRQHVKTRDTMHEGAHASAAEVQFRNQFEPELNLNRTELQVQVLVQGE